MSFNSKKKMVAQKYQIASILLFLALFSLFFSSISFAANDQTQDQKNIMRHLVNGTPSCHLSKTNIKEFQDSEGHCLGFSAMWLYAKWLQVVHPDIAKIYHGDMYKSIITDILGAWSNCAE